MEKTSDIFKKIRDTRVTFHIKKGSIKDRNGMDLISSASVKYIPLLSFIVPSSA